MTVGRIIGDDAVEERIILIECYAKAALNQEEAEEQQRAD